MTAKPLKIRKCKGRRKPTAFASWRFGRRSLGDYAAAAFARFARRQPT
jgi:hypothetical protein